MKKFSVLVLMMFAFSCSHAPSESRSLASVSGNETGNRIIRKSYHYFLKNKKEEVRLPWDQDFQIEMMDNSLVVKFEETNEVFPLAYFDEPLAEESVSRDEVHFKVTTNKKDREFKFGRCYWENLCVPDPRFETVVLEQQIEIKALDGQVLCLEHNYNYENETVNWQKGPCPKK